MGCCYSSEEDKDQDVPHANERTPLLDPSQADHIQQIQGGRASRNSIGPNQKGDEQSEFTRILRQTALNVIDVTSSESQNMEQGEMQDRATQYSNRLNMVLSASGKSRVFQLNMPSSITSPQMTLTAPPVSLSDIQLISNFSEKCSSSAKEIKIQHKESLVVTFGVP